MAKAHHRPKKWIGDETPDWERKRFVLQEGNRDTRAKQIAEERKKAISMGKRPPLTKEQKQAGARRIA